MKRRSRAIESMNLSFLDVISCGFGSIILLLVLTKVFDPMVFDKTIADLDGYLAELEQTLVTLRGETLLLNRNLLRKEDFKTARIDALTSSKARLAARETAIIDNTESTAVQQQLKLRLESLNSGLDIQKQGLLAQYQDSKNESVIGGIPLDSEYVIFVIDASPSMTDYGAWTTVVKKMEEVLEIYPNLKGIQVMDSGGRYMFPAYTDQWVTDTPVMRQEIIKRLKTWFVSSPSSPVKGITKAIATFYRPGLEIAVWVVGDAFNPFDSGRFNTPLKVIKAVRRINRPREGGRRSVRIHGLGFPVHFVEEVRLEDAYAFSTLMRALCEENDGAFIAIDRY